MGYLEMSKRALLAGADINRKEGMMLQRPFGVVGQNLEIQKTTDSARFWSSLVLTTNYPFLLIFSALFNFTGVLLCDNICRQPPGRISWASPHCTWQWGQGSLKSSGAKTSVGSMTGLSSLSDQLVLYSTTNRIRDLTVMPILHWCIEELNMSWCWYWYWYWIPLDTTESPHRSTSWWCSPELARLLVESKADLQQQTVREPNGGGRGGEVLPNRWVGDIGGMSCRKIHLTKI